MSIKTSIKKVLKLLHRHDKSRSDVYIFTLPRTGSTLLAEILNCDRNVKVVSEPFAIHHENKLELAKYIKQDNISERYVDSGTVVLENIYRYLSDLSKGNSWNSYYWSDVTTGKHSFKTNATVFKIHKVCYFFDDVIKHFENDKGLYLLRHPVSHSLSRLRKGWDVYIDQYAGSDKIKNVLSPEAIDKIQDVKRNGSKLEHFVLSWCLENYWFFYLYKRNNLPPNIIPVLYEDLVLKPEESIMQICNYTGIVFSPDMLSVLKMPSSGIVHSTKETRDQIVSGNKEYLLNRWKDSVEAKSLENIRGILRSFEIPFYTDI